AYVGSRDAEFRPRFPVCERRDAPGFPLSRSCGRPAVTANAAFVALPGRALLAIEGQDRRSFLQGLVSNDVMRVSPGRVVWAALLTPQGKFLHEFFIGEIGETLYLECEAARRGDLKRRLALYKLRAKVALGEVNDLEVFAAWGEGALQPLGLDATPGAAAPLAGGRAWLHPRHAAMGA